MDSRGRILASLQHTQPDRVPFDLGGCHVSTIHVQAYRNLCQYLGIDPEPVVISDVNQQIVTPNDALLERLEVDTRGLFPLCSHNLPFDNVTESGEYLQHVDEWSFTHQMPKENGWWWSLAKSPIDGMMADPQSLANYSWPKGDDPMRVAGLREKAQAYLDAGKIVMCKGLCAGLFEMGQRIRGMDNFLCDLLTDPKSAETIMDKLLEVKKQFWAMTLDEIGDLVDIVVETDDYGTQQSQLISYDTYKQLIDPRLRELVGFIKDKLASVKPAGHRGYVFLHSCGNVRPFINDFIDMGIDILNPVHITAEGMSPAGLKADYGEKITFWGGGVDTQGVLPSGTPAQVKEDVKRNIEALMPGGGYVFNTVHNIQAEVRPENIMAMWEAMRQFGQY